MQCTLSSSRSSQAITRKKCSSFVHCFCSVTSYSRPHGSIMRSQNISSLQSLASIDWTKECIAFAFIGKRMKSHWHLIAATSISMIATLVFQYRLSGTHADDSMYQRHFADTMHEGILIQRSCPLHSKGNMQIYSAKSTYCKCAHLSSR